MVIQQERLKSSTEKKEEGNKEFSQGNYEQAIGWYIEALEICPKNRTERALYHGNIAACYMKMVDYFITLLLLIIFGFVGYLVFN